MRWTEADKKRVRAILDHITAGSSQAELARKLGAESRATVNNWYRRGQVPIDNIPGVIKAAEPDMTVSPGNLHPQARVIVQEQAKAANKARGVKQQ